MTNIINSTKGTSSTENVFRSAMEEFKNVIDTGKIGSVKTKVKQIPNVGDASVFGASGTRTKQIAEISKGQEPAKSTFQKVDLGGVITIKIDAPPGVSVEYLNKTIADTFNSDKTSRANRNEGNKTIKKNTINLFINKT